MVIILYLCHKMAGIYIHIPFCKTRCSYCDFHSGTDMLLVDVYLQTLEKEMHVRADYLQGEAVRTIYFGGGTPSLLAVEQLKRVFDGLAANFDLARVEEVTLECNPDDLSDAFLHDLQSLPINRLSIGVQSFNDDELRAVARRHSARQAVEAIERCQQNGFANISVDLIIGLPHQTRESYRQSLAQVLALGVQHVSVYVLSYEEGTALWQRCQCGALVPMDDELVIELFNYTREQLTAAGFEHYEISNYAQKGMRSKHNSSYWAAVPYIGLGSGAHSYNGASRSWNVANTKQYCEALHTDKFVVEQEILTEEDVYNEYVMVALRTVEGVDVEKISSKFVPHFLQAIEPFVVRGIAKKTEKGYALTAQGVLLSDTVIRDLMI